MAGGHLGKNCLKKSPFVKKQFVPMAAFGNDLVPLVECCHGVGEGDLKLLHEAEVTGSHFPAVGWSLADNRPALRKRYILVL